ncbi:MAG: hypothetical protein NZ699_16440 [Roseiflexus sp.]|nr:hypothetical protein [Roseiflexus sp.]MCS7290712.1 hypothetical protein [Roseiflexus sp.]MDW8148417.1 hypothetical protein [Roseiflexaceae bacterium]MDW8232686.1 hypothetical protein [Roseiflexaceae bacterium]
MGIVLLVIATLATGFIAAITSTSAATAEPFHTRLVRMAERGDPRARDVLQRVDAHAARRGTPGVANERWVGQRAYVSSVQVEVVGLEPFYLKLYNNVTLSIV